MIELDKLINEALNGNEQSYKELIQAVLPMLNNIARIHLSSEEDIEDAIQETIILVHRKLYQLKDTNIFRTWIVRILINECNSILRKNKKQKEIISKVIIFKLFKFSSNEIEKSNNKLDFLSMLNCLNEKEKTDLILFYKYKYSIEEIADIQKESVNTIKSRIFRAKQKLKNNGGEEFKNE